MKKRALLLGLISSAVTMPARAWQGGIDEAVLQEVNAFRRSQGRPPLRLEGRLSRAAQLHSRDMLNHNRMSHSGSDGSDAGLRITRAGYRWRSYRENVGAGYMGVQDAVMGWVYSPGHRENLLADDVTQVGVGYADGPGMMAGNIPRRFWTLVLAAPR
ncbi:CAP domain-containing protein [Neoroseomonas soli]|uniref:CAP domain-containing protein n=1 Tax=Neoroseomonas soli TaxID=1081025 RepID=A0A9X9X013_9PROT|nr:CAP domain-containing protein [Neoroseomonas soli]MBR0672742.1 CAP domain-containing protein [Neoroseomonas soli]